MPVNARATGEISVRVKFKKSPYQLDTELREVDLRIDESLSGSTSITRTLTLPANTYGFTRLALKRVDFADGSTWRPDTDRCRYSVAGSVLQAK
jgi:hypothetical protein